MEKVSMTTFTLVTHIRKCGVDSVQNVRRVVGSMEILELYKPIPGSNKGLNGFGKDNFPLIDREVRNICKPFIIKVAIGNQSTHSNLVVYSRERFD
ncbi:hypothetical protein XELAEV_18035075mg [Xenopus laevis]|uniref:Uncharacterized protein n=1 Tax=Xenopus laevis TaxID=8355 RepID=A0A974CGC4_XENLA|nr:hypothetical protein XELAEV_18035075mg [Xenopus laevis]